MKVFRESGQRKYVYAEQNGKTRAFRQEEIWHIPAFGFDGLMGYSRITLARNSIGLSMAAEKFGSKFFQNGAIPSLVVKHPGKLGDEAFANLSKSWKETHGGTDNAQKPVIFEEGMSIEKIGIPPDDAQFIETRRFQLSEIARMFRVPPHMIGDVTSSTSWGSGIEQQELHYLSHTLRPWLKRIEQGAQKDLLLEDERKNIVIEHLVEDFLRTDIAARMAAYVQAIQNGIMTRNEARERENMNPVDGLDKMLIPLNMTTVDADDDGSGDDVSDDSTPLDGDGASPDPSSDDRKALRDADLAPFVLDMAQRITKREANEVSDAAKRWLEKGKSERFMTWLEQFYKRDHADFMLKTLSPLAKIAPEMVRYTVKKYLETQGAKVFRAYQDGDDLHELTKNWLDELPGQITGDLVGIDMHEMQRSKQDVYVTVNNYPDAAPVVNVQPPTVNIDNRAEPLPITVQVNVDPTPIQVTNEVIPASVAVAAPSVSVENRMDAPVVTVNVPQQPVPDVVVNVPKNKSVSVKRGRDGKITGLEAD